MAASSSPLSPPLPLFKKQQQLLLSRQGIVAFSTIPPPAEEKGMIGKAFESVSRSAANKLQDRRLAQQDRDFKKAMDSLLSVKGAEKSASLTLTQFASSIEESSADAFGWKGKIPGMSDKEQIAAMKRNIEITKGVGNVLQEIYGDEGGNNFDATFLLTDRKPIPEGVKLRCRLSVDPAASNAELEEALESYLRTSFVRSWMMWREEAGLPKPESQADMEKMMDEDRESKRWKFDARLMKNVPSARRDKRRRIKQRKGWIKQSLP